MIIRVPDTLTIDNSDKYEISIRLMPDGISCSGQIPSENDSFFSETVYFDKEILFTDSLKNFFFDNPFMSFAYRSIRIICPSRKYTLSPDSIYSVKDKELLFWFCHQEEYKMKVVAQPLKKLNATMLFEIDSDVYEFLMRSMTNPQFVHYLSDMLVAWQKESLTCYPKQVYVVVGNRSFDLVCFNRDELLFINSFDYEHEQDIVYYIMYACKRLEINQFDDCLHFFGNASACKAAMEITGNYIRHLDYVSSLPECGL